MNLSINNNHIVKTKKNLLSLIIRVIQALSAAITAVIIVHSFRILIKLLQNFGEKVFIFLPIWTITGAIFVALIIYRISPNSRGEGIPSYIKSINHQDGKFSLKETIFKYFAALLTLGTFGNGGIVGPVGRVTAGINSYIEEKIHTTKTFDLKIGGICGFAAAIGVIFHAPIAGGFFAVEILEQSNMKYRYLFPSLLSSAFSVLLAKVLHLPSFYRFSVPDIAIPNNIYVYVILVGILTGFAGRYYNLFYKKISIFIQRNEKNHLLAEIVIGSLIVSIIAYFINPNLLGTSNQLIYHLTNDIDKIYGNLPTNMNLIFILIILALVKSIGNCITVGTGLSAGFTGPIIIVGMIIGVLTATVAGIQIYSIGYYTLICAGLTGMLASSINTPIAAMILSIELFGYNYAIPSIIATIIAFKINDYNTIYEYK